MGEGCAFTEDPGAEEFEGLNLNELGVDEAYLRVKSQYPEDLFLYTRSGDCYGCPLSYRQDIIDGQVNCSTDASCTIETAHPLTFLLSKNKNVPYLNDSHDPGTVCSLSNERFGEFGVYDLVINTDGSCQVDTSKDPVFEYGALIIFLGLYVGLALLVWLVEFGRQKGVFEKVLWKLRKNEVNIEMRAAPAEDKPPAKRPRIKSLDTFRGISIILMIFVNYGGGHYWFMEHATWNGLQVADLVFPWFMWIMGVCIPMGLRSQIKRNVPWYIIMHRVIKRSAKLFMLGLIQNTLGSPWSGPPMETLRIPGVLQRFAICYLLVTAIALLFTTDSMSRTKQLIHEGGQWAVHLSIVLAHTCIIFLMPVPGCPTGYLGPGGKHLLQDGEPSPQCIGGATGEVDRWLLGSNHIYQNPTAKFTYDSGAFDPEGILGTMLSVFQVFLGLQAGMILQKYSGHKDRVIRWVIWGTACGILGTVLCLGTMNDGPIPVNKNLWSLSYVMVTSCFAFFLLAACYLLIDVWNVWNGSPCYQAGMNSIFMYMGHNVAYSLFPWHWSIGPMRTHLILLGECLWGVTLWAVTALYLHSIGKFYAV